MKIGERVWFITDPEHTTEGKWALDGKIVQITMRESESGVEILDCQIDMGTFDEYTWQNRDQIFATEKEAIANSMWRITEKIDKLERRLARYRELS